MIFILVYKGPKINLIVDNSLRKPLSAFSCKAGNVGAQMYSAVWSILEDSQLQKANNTRGHKKGLVSRGRGFVLRANVFGIFV